MRVDVFLTPGELASGDMADRTVVVIDVLRAGSTIVEALAAGARSIFPTSSIEEAARLASNIGRDEVILCGERKCLPIDGFDLGNSPREFTRDCVAGKTLIMSTTNGTHTLSLAATADRVLIAAPLNLDAVVDELAGSEVDPVIVCSGRERHFSLEDAVFAGELTRRLIDRRSGDWQRNDGAVAALLLAREYELGEDLLRSTAGGRAVVEAGLGDDLAFCAQLNRHQIVPVLQDRYITLAPPAVASRGE